MKKATWLFPSLTYIGALLDSIGKSFQDVVKTTIFLTDLTHFATLNKLYQEAFQTDFPTRSTVQVAALPKGALIEIELIVA
jgi:2-iminobutanoate/2-iminopropanoate deaminase